MGQHIFFHNLTKKKFNLDMEDLISSMTNKNEEIMYSEAGNALVLPLSKDLKEDIEKEFEQQDF